jgi:hypothetical protein
MSTDGGGRRSRPKAALAADDVTRIARALAEKYGPDALAFAADRARIAGEVGDELALDAWRDVIDATRALLRRMADA